MAAMADDHISSKDDFENEPFIANGTSMKSKSKSRWTLKTVIISNLVTFILASLLYTAIASTVFKSYSKRLTPLTKTLTCGSTVAEAKSLGCQYDVLSNLWVPEPCLDWETINEFQEKAPWQGYSDVNGTRLLTVEEMGEATKDKGGYWTTAREHLVHCSLMWKRLHKGYMGDRRILDSNTISYAHTLHCSHSQVELGDALPRQLDDQLVIRTTAGFSTCEVEI